MQFNPCQINFDLTKELVSKYRYARTSLNNLID